MRGLVLVAAALAFAPSATMAMNVATFLAKADAVQRRGALGMLSSDARALMGELQGATKALKAERLSAQAAGRQPAYCPKGGGLSQGEIITAMRAIPADQRPRTQVKEALRGALARKHPC